MAYRVVFVPPAIKESQEAADWYEERSFSTSEKFRQSLNDAIKQIESGRRTHQIGRTMYHYVRLSRFPYRAIFYFVNEQVARVVAVAHNRRRPGYWRSRR